MKEAVQTVLFGLDLSELTALAEAAGQPTYRARQLFQALYSERIGSVDLISTLPKDFRAWIAEK